MKLLETESRAGVLVLRVEKQKYLEKAKLVKQMGDGISGSGSGS